MIATRREPTRSRDCRICKTWPAETALGDRTCLWCAPDPAKLIQRMETTVSHPVFTATLGAQFREHYYRWTQAGALSGTGKTLRQWRDALFARGRRVQLSTAGGLGPLAGLAGTVEGAPIDGRVLVRLDDGREINLLLCDLDEVDHPRDWGPWNQ